VGSYAVCIGINDYGGRSDLRGCVNDVSTWKTLLLERGFLERDIRICLDKEATGQNVIALLRWLSQERRPEDRLALTFSGHGVWTFPVGGSGWECCICCADVANWDQAVITSSQFCHELAGESRNLTAMLDCCFAGGMWAPGNPPIPELPAAVKNILFDTSEEDRSGRGVRALPCPARVLERATAWLETQRGRG
jgi:hypothetical protein